jgi:molecular chaperone GrpE
MSLDSSAEYLDQGIKGMTVKTQARSSDSVAEAPEEKTPTSENQISDPAAAPQDPITQLQAELATAKAESEQWRDRFLRKAAEFDNFRKRTEREKVDSILLANSSVLIEFLPILDACERAMNSFQQAAEVQGDIEQYREGVQLLYKQLHDTLNRVGVVPIEAQGRAFDPHMHEALLHEKTSDHEENTIIRELRRGYLFKDRLLRPAQVAVASRSQTE